MNAGMLDLWVYWLASLQRLTRYNEKVNII